MTSRELDRWADFWALEPFGPAREDLRAGVIAAMLSTGKGPDFFFPNLKPEVDPEDRDEQIRRTLMGMTTERKDRGN